MLWLWIILGIVAAFFAVTFIIYWFNLDMKLVYKIYHWLQKHYDRIERDKRL